MFAAGNSGPGAATVGTPGNGKNMITVGASENDRPAWTDGCGVGPSGADNAMDVIDFSSRGPSPGGRKKPEVIAPGTHIQGTASTAPGLHRRQRVRPRSMPTDADGLRRVVGNEPLDAGRRRDRVAVLPLAAGPLPDGRAEPRPDEGVHDRPHERT